MFGDDKCIYAKHGGHPQLPITDDMKRALTKRREKVIQYRESKGQGRGSVIRRTDAEMKKLLDAADHP